MAVVASRPWSLRVPPLLWSPRALGKCSSILLGMLPESKFLSILKEGNDVERPTWPWLSTGQSPCLTSAWTLGSPINQEAFPHQRAYYDGKYHGGHSSFFLIVVKHTLYKINHVLMYSSVELNTLTMVCSHYHYRVPELSHHPNGNPVPIGNSSTSHHLLSSERKLGFESQLLPLLPGR